MLLEGHAESNWGLLHWCFLKSFNCFAQDCYLQSLLNLHHDWTKGDQRSTIGSNDWDLRWFEIRTFPWLHLLHPGFPFPQLQELSGWACWAKEGGLGEKSQIPTTLSPRNALPTGRCLRPSLSWFDALGWKHWASSIGNPAACVRCDSEPC